MREIHSYVVRIYRRDVDSLAGVIEQVQNGRTTPFQSIVELWDVLSGRRRSIRRATRRMFSSVAQARHHEER